MRKLLHAAATRGILSAGLLLAALACLPPTPASAAPYPVQNHSPVFFGLLYPAADTPGVLSDGDVSARADMHYSSIFFHDNNPGWSYMFDMELAQLTFGLRRGVGPFEAGMELPLFYMGGGFLDQAILDSHQKFGFADYIGQREAPRNRYLYSVTHNGKIWNAPLPYTVAPGDVTVWLKRELVADRSGGLAAKLLVQAPSAITDTGLGNGAWEYGVMFIGQRRIEDVEFTVNAGVINPGFIDRGDRMELKPMYLWDVAAEHFFMKRLSALAQLSYATSPYGEGAADMFRRTWLALTVGGRYITASGRPIDISFTEDLSQTAPDFTFGIGFPF